MVIVSIKDGDLILQVKGIGKVLALRNELVIPLNHVRGVTADPGAFSMPRGLRAPGTSIPGLLYAGTFYHKGEKVFWEVHNPAKAVVIELAEEDFTRLVIEVENPNDVVSSIEDAIA
ncbi:MULTISPECIES: hypothetical protein [Acidithrix]|uniref:Bacterial Pleckstrin homology domain-containing protein n=1 Tax=Acidithrix ferrooxidans TaxID=1280514 RepID=A0A0D8HCJ3_9ACTN|nr:MULTISPECIES: hypothetical protein [Acidithrix]KJF15648.1 hypothetical protein AXFE_35200 [Acidithrix ferrooxidans]CAG4903178.1 unnamed protein product [Acidithrix sp. C25]